MSSFIPADSVFERVFTHHAELFWHEGKWWYDAILERYCLSRQRIHFLTKSFRPVKILDAGCGGGGVGEVISLDISSTSLCYAKEIYSNVVDANLNNIPIS